MFCYKGVESTPLFVVSVLSAECCKTGMNLHDFCSTLCYFTLIFLGKILPCCTFTLGVSINTSISLITAHLWLSMSERRGDAMTGLQVQRVRDGPSKDHTEDLACLNTFSCFLVFHIVLLLHGFHYAVRNISLWRLHYSRNDSRIQS